MTPAVIKDMASPRQPGVAALTKEPSSPSAHAAAAAAAAPPPPFSSSSFASSPTAAKKRSAPSLLPPFEPLLSPSPALPHPRKRQNTGSGSAHFKYPTPVPTSSTGILSSSPFRRTASDRTTSERVPLSAVPAVELPENGEVVALGRSSCSSHFQLSANRLVSRMHVKARYIAATSATDTSKLEIYCNGWNGLMLHCQGRTWELSKGDSFTSVTDGTDILVDVLDARVMICWPKRPAGVAGRTAPLSSDSGWDDSPSPRSNPKRSSSLLPSSSPLRRATRIKSPDSPTPAGHATASRATQRLLSLLPMARDEDGDREADGRDHQAIKIFEDDSEPQLVNIKTEEIDVGASMRTEALTSFSSELSNPSGSESGDHDPNEENDPIIHSFGPYGANIAGRLASITTQSPEAVIHVRRSHTASSNATVTAGPAPDRTSSLSSLVASSGGTSGGGPEASPRPSVEVDVAITNHVANQLAFSRLSSTPLSTIMQNLPVGSKEALASDALREAIEVMPCIGVIPRHGKDAAGKALESEYYYIPERDGDEQRRNAVVDGLRKPSLRSCRKQHKQYYWKRPRTP